MACQTKKMSLFRPNAGFYKFATQAILLYSSLKILQWHYNQIQPRNKKNMYHPSQSSTEPCVTHILNLSSSENFTKTVSSVVFTKYVSSVP